MSAATGTMDRGGADAVRRLFRDQPIIPLTGLLILLVIVIGLASPGIVSPGWAGVIVPERRSVLTSAPSFDARPAAALS